MVLPLLPNATYYVSGITGNNKLSSTTVETEPQDNRLMIEKIGVNVPINEGNDLSALNNGSWRRPNTSTPSDGGNTVIVGHRFTYTGNDIFYHLDKVSLGDNIRVWWQGKSFDYTVRTVEEVEPTAIEIEAPTENEQLTLYTCTPLWSAKNRLVIVATPKGENQ